MNYWFSSETTSIIILFHRNGRKSIFSSLSQEVLSFELVTLLPICRIFDIFRCFTLSPQKSWTEICRILIANLLTFRGSGRWTTCSQYIRCHNPSCLCGVLLVIYFLPRYPINSKNSQVPFLLSNNNLWRMRSPHQFMGLDRTCSVNYYLNRLVNVRGHYTS